MIRTVYLELRKDNYKDNMLGIVPSTYYLCHQFENNAVQLELLNPEILDLSKYEIVIFFKAEHNPLGYIVLEEGTYTYALTFNYTSKRNLEVQYLFRDKETKEIKIRTNVVNFKIYKSIPPANTEQTLLGLLIKLITSGELVLSIEDGYLKIKDKLGNEVGEYYIGEDDTETAEDYNTDDVIIEAKGGHLTLLNEPFIISNSRHVHYIKFRLDKTWNSIDSKKVALYQTKANQSYQTVVDLIKNEAAIPEIFLTFNDYLNIALIGYDSDGTLRKTSEYLSVLIHEGADNFL